MLRSVGQRRLLGNNSIPNLPDLVVGEEVEKYRGLLELSYPMDNGVITDWQDMRALWDFTFKQALSVDPHEHAILLTEPPLNPKRNRERMVEEMFEHFEFKQVQVAVQAVLTLYAQGLQTGVVVDSGDGVTHIIPVFDGYTMNNLTKRLDIAGRDVTRQLIRLLAMQGYQFHEQKDFELVRSIKERCCMVSCNLKQDIRLAQETTCMVETFTLPDGKEIKVRQERFEAPEILFNPSLIGKETAGLSEQVFNAINGAEVDLRTDLYRNIVLSGGTTMFPGLPTRLEQDLRALYLDRILKGDSNRMKMKIRIEDPPKRKHMVFQGGAVMADLMNGNDAFWISRAQWAEEGPACLNKLK